MAKVLKFYYEYQDHYDDTCRVEIYEEGFGGVAAELIAGAKPFTIKANKEVAEQYLGGICPTKFQLQALSTSTFKASSFLSQIYGDVTFVFKRDNIVEYQGVIEPFESLDLDEYEGNYFVQLGGECGLSYLKSVDYTPIENYVQLKTILKTCIDKIPSTESFGYKILDNTLAYKVDGISTIWFDTYVDDLQYLDKSCYDVLSEILRGSLEIFLGRGNWNVRNNYELANGTSTIRIYDSSMALQTTTTSFRDSVSFERLKGGNLTHQFSFKNVTIVKPKSESNNKLLPGGEFEDLTNWTANGTAALVFSIDNGRLYNNGNTVKELPLDNNYYESQGVTFYPFQSIFNQVDNDIPKIEIDFEGGMSIQSLRIQIAVKQIEGGNTSTYYLTNEGGWYEQKLGITKTPIYYVSDTKPIEVPRPPYRSNLQQLFPITSSGYFHGANNLFPTTNIAYQLFVRVYLPERVDNAASGSYRDSYINFIRLSFERANNDLFDGFEKSYGVETLVDRKNKINIKLSTGFNTAPQGLETIFFDSLGNDPIIEYSKFDTTTKQSLDELVANEHLEYLSVRRKKWSGSIISNIDFSKILTIDGIEYRLHNVENDTRSQFAKVTLLELSVDAVTPTVKRLDIDGLETPGLASQKILFRDLNVSEKIDGQGRSYFDFSKDPIFDTGKLLKGEVFLVKEDNADSAINFIDNDGNVTDYIKPITDGFELFAEGGNALGIKTDLMTADYALQAPNLSADATIATDATAWMLGGNTVGAKKTIGTIDNHAFGIITNNTEKVTILSNGNVGFGTISPTEKLDVNGNALIGLIRIHQTGGTSNTFLGQNTGINNTGSNNTAIGLNSLLSNTTGTANTAVGVNSLFSNTTGSFNIANGLNSLFSNTTGINNTATGVNSLRFNTTGTQNTAIGRDSLRSNTTGSSNTAIGKDSLYYNTIGNSNTTIGVNSLFSNTTGSSNTAIGTNSLYFSTTGTQNTAIGLSSLQSNTTGSNNTANGRSSLFSNTTGSNNTANGKDSLRSNTTGSNNTAIGFNSGQSITTGSNNIVIGSNTASRIATLSNWIIFSDGAGNERFTVDPSGNVGIGTTAPTEKLHVDGTIRTTNLKINNGAAVGKVWQCTNADGSGSWVSPLASERYIGEWDASSGTAPSVSPTTGDYYVVSVAGTYSAVTYAAGDEIYWDGTAWLRRQNFLTLPTASATVLGGVKIGSGLSIDGSGVVTVNTLNQNTTGSAATLTTTRNIAATGDIAWNVNFNGGDNVTAAAILPNIATAGTYRSVTVNAKGQVTAGTNPTTIAGYGITDYDSLWDARLAIKSTTNLSEGTNLYYTDARSRAAISLTTTGSSGASTYNAGVLNIPNYTLAGLGGEAAFSKNTAFNKNFGTVAGTVAEGNHTHTLSQITDYSIAGVNYWTKTVNDLGYSGGNVGIGTTTPSYNLHVNGTTRTSKLLVLTDIDTGEQLQVTGTIKLNDGSNRTIVGRSSGTTVTDQSSFGANSGYANTGIYQSSFGSSAGRQNTGMYQSAFGYNAGRENTGIYQSAFGVDAGYANTGAFQSTFGYNAGRDNTGFHQSAFGILAGYQNTGANQSAFGVNAGRENTGDNVVAIGYEAGMSNASDNQFILKQANVNTTPLIQGDFATGNVAIGKNTASFNVDIAQDINYDGNLFVNGIAGTDMKVLANVAGDDTWASLNTSYLSDWSTAWDAKYNAIGKNTAYNKNFGTTVGTVSEGDHGHVIEDITSLTTVLDGKLDTPTLTENYIPRWNGSDFENSGYFSNTTGLNKIIGQSLRLLSSNSGSANGFLLNINGTFLNEFNSTSNLWLTPFYNDTHSIKIGTRNTSEWSNIELATTGNLDIYADEFITIHSPIYEEITLTDGDFQKQLHGLRLDEFDAAIIGTNINTLGFEVLTKGFDGGGNSIDHANVINAETGRWQKIVNGQPVNYLIAGEGGSGAVGTLQQVTDNGAVSSNRLKFGTLGSNENYALMSDISTIGLDYVLGVDNKATSKNIELNIPEVDGNYTDVLFTSGAGNQIGFISATYDNSSLQRLNVIANNRLQLQSLGSNVEIYSSSSITLAPNTGTQAVGIINLFGRLFFGNINAIPNFNTKADAINGGLQIGDVYRNGENLKIVI